MAATNSRDAWDQRMGFFVYPRIRNILNPLYLSEFVL